MEIGKILRVLHVTPEPFPLPEPQTAPQEPSPAKPAEEPLVPA